MPDPFKFSKPRSRYAVVGHPVSHSKSPSIHRAFAKQCTVTMEYEAIQLDLGGFAQGVRNLQAADFGGANVTLPFKEQARRIADRLSPRATIAGAVNTLKFADDGGIEGDNTDGAGLVVDLIQNIGISLAGTRLLVIGAGGAVRGILEPLLGAGVAGVTSELGPVGIVIGGAVGGVCALICINNLNSPNKKEAEQIRNEMCDQVDDDLCAGWPTSWNSHC